jgi:uncharacterized protein
MKAVFADSFHFLALLNDNERAHRRAVLEHRRTWQNMATTDCVILEVGDALSHPRDRDDFLALLESFNRDSRIKIVRLTPELLGRGVQLFRDRLDKSWPLTDCISFVVMKDEGIKDALTGDKHFEQAGFTALLGEDSTAGILGKIRRRIRICCGNSMRAEPFGPFPNPPAKPHRGPARLSSSSNRANVSAAIEVRSSSDSGP